MVRHMRSAWASGFERWTWDGPTPSGGTSGLPPDSDGRSARVDCRGLVATRLPGLFGNLLRDREPLPPIGINAWRGGETGQAEGSRIPHSGSVRWSVDRALSGSVRIRDRPVPEVKRAPMGAVQMDGSTTIVCDRVPLCPVCVSRLAMTAGEGLGSHVVPVANSVYKADQWTSISSGTTASPLPRRFVHYRSMSGRVVVLW